MGRLIDVDNIEYYLEEGGSVVAFKADIDQIPSAQPDKEALDDAYAHGYTYAESKYRAMMSDSDCISRQAAIHEIEEELKKDTVIDTYGRIWETGEYYKGLTLANAVISRLPSAQPEPQWIPVTPETLPERNRVVIAYTGKGAWDYGMYRGHMSDIHNWHWKHKTIKYVLYWMYKEDALPSPY